MLNQWGNVSRTVAIAVVFVHVCVCTLLVGAHLRKTLVFGGAVDDVKQVVLKYDSNTCVSFKIF